MLARATATIAAVVLAGTALSASALYAPPSNEAVCNGQLNSGPGGMFGYSVALSSGADSDYSWMVVGKPWDSSIHIYTIANPDWSDVKQPNKTSQALRANSTGPATENVVNVAQLPLSAWTPLQLIGDTSNGTYPLRAISLFGYSVTLSDDGAWLAVGIPGRSLVPLTQTVPLQFHSYTGAVRIYRRQDTTADISPTARYRYMGEITNPNSGTRFWDKFGSKVRWQAVRDVASDGRNVTRQMLFVVANAGWDGASTAFYDAQPDTSGWPAGETTDVSRAGVYVYELVKPTQISPISGSIVGPGNILTYRQHIRQKSTVPLGSLGADIVPVVKPVDPKSHRDELTLLVRDFVVLERQLPANLLTSDLCPSGACSYIDTVVDGQRVAVNGTGVVVEYRFDTESDTFEETGGVLASLDFPVASAVATGNFALDVNGGYQPSDWARDDWFGVGLSVGYDQKYDRYVAAVGAPRDASGLYSFYLAKGAASQQWTAGQFLPNDDYYRRSFFGQKVQFAGDGRFLVVADPAGSGNSLGRGNVFLYYRRSTSEIMVPVEYNNVAKPPIAGGNRVPYTFDKLSQLLKTERRMPAANSYESDHFGFGMATNRYFVVAASPIEQCIFTYALPLVFDLDSESPNPPPGPGDYTVTPRPTGGADQPSAEGDTQTLYYGLIGGGCALFLVLPVAFFLIRRRHHRKVMMELKGGKDVKDLSAAAGTALGSEDQLMGGTVGDLSSGESLNQP